MKPGKVLCCMLVLALLEIYRAQKLGKYKKVFICAHINQQFVAREIVVHTSSMSVIKIVTL